MVRWRDDDGAMARWSIAPSRYRYRAIVLSSSHHRAIVIAPSLHRAITPSSSLHRVIVIAPSRHRHRAIAPSTYKSMVRWRDSEVHGPIRIPYNTVSHKIVKICLLAFPINPYKEKQRDFTSHLQIFHVYM